MSLCLSHEQNTGEGGPVLPDCVQEGFTAGDIGVQEKRRRAFWAGLELARLVRRDLRA